MLGLPVRLTIASVTSEDANMPASSALSSGGVGWRSQQRAARLELALDPPSPIGTLLIANSGTLEIACHAACRGNHYDRRGYIGAAPPRPGHAEQGDAIELLPRQSLPAANATLCFKAGRGAGKLNTVAPTQDWTHIAIDVYGSPDALPGLASIQLLKPAATTTAPPPPAVVTARPPQYQQHKRAAISYSAQAPPPPKRPAPPQRQVAPPAPSQRAPPPCRIPTQAAVPRPPPRALRPPQPPQSSAPIATAPVATAPIASSSTTTTSSSSSSSKAATFSDPPLCTQHSHPTRRAFVKKAGKHFGKPVWVCSLPNGCGFVGWATPEAAVPAVANSAVPAALTTDTAAAAARSSTPLLPKPCTAKQQEAANEQPLATPPTANALTPSAAARNGGSGSGGSSSGHSTVPSAGSSTATTNEMMVSEFEEPTQQCPSGRGPIHGGGWGKKKRKRRPSPLGLAQPQLACPISDRPEDNEQQPLTQSDEDEDDEEAATPALPIAPHHKRLEHVLPSESQLKAEEEEAVAAGSCWRLERDEEQEMDEALGSQAL